MQNDKKQQTKRRLPAELIFEIANFYSCLQTLQFLACDDANKTHQKRTIFDQILDEFIIGNYLIDMERPSIGAKQEIMSMEKMVSSGFGWSDKCFFVALTSHLKRLKSWDKMRIINAELNDYQKHAGQFLGYCSALEVPEISFNFVQFMASEARNIAQRLNENAADFAFCLGRLQHTINLMVQVFHVDADKEAQFQFATEIMTEKGIAKGSDKYIICKNVTRWKFDDPLTLMPWLAVGGQLNLCFGTAMVAFYPLSKRSSKQLPADGINFEEWFAHAFQHASTLCALLKRRFRIARFWEGDDEKRHQFFSRVLWNIQDNAAQCAGNAKKMSKLHHILSSMLGNLCFENTSIYICALNCKVYELLLNEEEAQRNEYLRKTAAFTADKNLKIDQIAEILNGKGKNALNLTNQRYGALACDYIMVFFYALVKQCNRKNIRLAPHPSAN